MCSYCRTSNEPDNKKSVSVGSLLPVWRSSSPRIGAFLCPSVQGVDTKCTASGTRFRFRVLEMGCSWFLCTTQAVATSRPSRLWRARGTTKEKEGGEMLATWNSPIAGAEKSREERECETSAHHGRDSPAEGWQQRSYLFFPCAWSPPSSAQEETSLVANIRRV